MEIQLLQQPDSTIARILLQNGEEIIAQAGAMISMSSHITTDTILRRGSGGGVLGGVKRIMGGESLFLSTFRATAVNSEVILAPQLMGDLWVYEMSKYKLVVQAGGFLACQPNIDIFLGFRGFKSVFAKESLFWLSLAGEGKVILNSFGAIYEVPVNGEYIVDTGHIVAFENSLKFKLSKANKGWLGALAGGEGLICRFSGEGKVYCQTHHPQAFGSLLGSKLPSRG